MKAERVEYTPKCPFCDKEIEQLGLHEGEPVKFLGMNMKYSILAVFSCPECHHIVGVAHHGGVVTST